MQSGWGREPGRRCYKQGSAGLTIAGAVLIALGLPAALCGIAGNWLGSRLAIKVGTEAVRRFLWISLSLLLATLIWRFFISPYLLGA